MFTRNRSFWLDSDANTFLIRDDSGLHRETCLPHRKYPSRLERDGWIKEPGDPTEPVYQKTIPGGWIIRSVGLRRGYELEKTGECKLAFPAWEWVEWDRWRLVWAAGGRLLTAPLKTNELGPVQVIHDFNEIPPPVPPPNPPADRS